MKLFKLSGIALLLALLLIYSPAQAQSYYSEEHSAAQQTPDNQILDVQSLDNTGAQSHHSNQNLRSRQTLTFKLTRTLGDGCQTLIDNFTADVRTFNNSLSLKTAAKEINFRAIANEWNNPNRYVTNVYRYDELHNFTSNKRFGQTYAWATNEINGCIKDSVLRQRIFSHGELLCDYTWETWENINNTVSYNCRNNYNTP